MLTHRTPFIFFLLLKVFSAQSQNLYFPPLSGTAWQSTSPAELGFCNERIDSLYAFLEAKNTKSFILLKDGKIVLERYFGTFVQDSIWYWASAGKSLTAFLVGQAQDEGLVNIQDRTDQYLGAGWTSAPPEKEALITLWHQLTMTSGLDDTFVPTPTEPDPNTCTDPECLNYLADAGTRWGYHTGAYRLLQDVIAEASGSTINQFTKNRLLDRVGMKGFWLNDVFFSKARDMARFGLLTLAQGRWENDTLLADANYFFNMTHRSQELNKSYGYLWWLNGQPSFMVPGLQLQLPGKLCPNGPDDMIAALGKNDQKIYVVPSKGWVVVRQGDASGYTGIGGDAVPILFDNALWDYLNQLECSGVSSIDLPDEPEVIVPNPASLHWTISGETAPDRVEVYDACGRLLQTLHHTGTVPASALPGGIYWLKITRGETVRTRRVCRL